MSVKLIAKSIWTNPGNDGQKIKRSVYAVLWQLWKRVVRKPRKLTLVNGRRFVAHPDCVVSSSLIYSQHPEFHELNFVRRLLDSEDVVVDVGANVGHIGLLISDAVAPKNIFAFEPTPVTFQRLTENWKFNQFPTEGLNHVAVGAETGTAMFADVTHPDTMNAQRISNDNSIPMKEIPLRTLDSYRQSWAGRRLGFIKIDVEGYEVGVFRGAMETLKHDRPRLIMFESLDGAVETEIAEMLRETGYRVFQLDANGKPQLDKSSSQNLFATPSEMLDKVVSN